MKEAPLDRLPEQRTARLARGALGRWTRPSGDRSAMIALVLVLAAGAALRMVLMLAQRPGFLGYSDSADYLTDSADTLFHNALRPDGYALVLRALRSMVDELSFVVIFQHALALAVALALVVVARRAGAGRWWSLLPAAVVALSGSEILLEHAVLSETVFVAAEVAALLAIVSLDGHRSAWGRVAVAGILLGAAATVRSVGLVAVPVVVAWIALTPDAGAVRRRFGLGAVCGAAAVLVFGAYVVAQERATGFLGLTSGQGWNLYGRAATFADCDDFAPPAGTRVLCERIPASRRPGVNTYIFDRRRSPADRAFGPPHLSSIANNQRLGRFARAAIIHQPLDWLSTVAGEDLPRFVLPDREPRAGMGLGPGGLVRELEDPRSARIARIAGHWWSTSGVFEKRDLLDALEAYERRTRIDGLVFLVLALLALAGPMVVRRRSRAVLVTTVALVGLLAPVFLVHYEARYAIPAFGPLAAAAAVGGSGLWARVRARRAGRAEP